MGINVPKTFFFLNIEFRLRETEICMNITTYYFFSKFFHEFEYSLRNFQ